MNFLKVLGCGTIFIFIFFSNSVIFAAGSYEIAVPVSIQEKPPVGAIVSREGEEYRLSNAEYDSQITGVIVDTSNIVLEYTEPQKDVYDDRFVVDTGEVLVRVNDTNGIIKAGDLVTASEVPGEAMRADKDGLVLGVALEDMKESTQGGSNLIRVSLHIQFATISETFTADSLLARHGFFGPLINTLLDIVKFAPEKISQTPPMIKYTFAILIVIIAIVLGFFLFGRVALRGIESLGRNPLARWTILSGVFINIIFVLLLIGFALLLAYFALTL